MGNINRKIEHMGKKEVYDELKELKWGNISNTQISSWLLWGDELEKINSNPNVINTNYVFVALNASFTTEGKGKWKSFHSGSKSDQNLRNAFNLSDYKGSYITDLIKFKSFDEEGNPKDRCKDSKSEKAMKDISSEVSIYNENVKLFLTELDSFDKPPILFAFGDDVYKMLLFNPEINKKYKIKKIPHFSARYYNGNDGRCYKTAFINSLSVKENNL